MFRTHLGSTLTKENLSLLKKKKKLVTIDESESPFLRDDFCRVMTIILECTDYYFCGQLVTETRVVVRLSKRNLGI